MKHEDTTYWYNAYMQELNAVVLYVVIFVPSQFSLHAALLTPVLVRHTARNTAKSHRKTPAVHRFKLPGWPVVADEPDVRPGVAIVKRERAE